MRAPLIALSLAIATAVACDDSTGPAPGPAPPLSIQPASTATGDRQKAPVGTTLPMPLRVLVRRGSEPAPGVTVDWMASQGTLSATRAKTDASGIAAVTWTLGGTAGTQTATALLGTAGIGDTMVGFSAVADPGPASRLAFQAQPVNLFAGRLFLRAVQVVSLDQYGNLATDFGESVTVTLPNGGALSGTTTTVAIRGLATFADLSIAQSGTGYTLTVSAGGLSSATSAAFDVLLPGPGRIAFQSSRDGNYEIYTMNADGSGVVRLTDEPATDAQPAWSPDGTKIAFVSGRDGSRHIYEMNPDGSGVAALPAGLDDTPAWSRDGTRLAGGSGYASRCGPFGQPCRRYNRLFVANADGSGLTVITNGITPAWSPDGRIAFVWGVEIYVMNADGSGLANLTNDPTFDDGPAWSPDGAKIAFVSNRGGAYDLYLMNAGGTAVTQLTHDQATEGRPAWSPDGTRIAFASDMDGDAEIYVMNADGSGVVALTDNPAADGWPAWAP